MNNMLKNPHFWKVWLPPHLITLAGLIMIPSWTIAAWAFIFYCLISGLGVAVGFHRYFSHRAFKTSQVWDQLMLYFGCLACHGNPFFWVALHNGLHHRYSDTDKDPHSPIHGLWHAYQGYAFTLDPKSVPLKAGAGFLRQSSWQWSVRYYHKVLWMSWIIAGLISPTLLVGLAVAQVWAIHQEATVNLLGHISGFGAYRNFDTKDLSVNRNLLGLITWGQALHNNHHHAPNKYDFGSIRWYEFDPCRIWVALIRKQTQ